MDPRTIDLTGRKFGKWTVLYQAGRAPNGKSWHILWMARCECGTEKIVRGYKVRLGESTGCGKLACNWKWAGDAVGYAGAHDRVQAARGRASEHLCVDGCGRQARDWSYKETTGYSGDPADYSPRCRECHEKFDHPGAACHSR